MRVKNWILLMSILLLMALPLSAQDPEPAWEAVIYEFGSSLITVLTEQGIQTTIPIPVGFRLPARTSEAYNPYQELKQTLAVDSDYHFLAGLQNGVLQIADLEAGSCCVTVDLSHFLQAETRLELGGFRADGAQVAVTYFVVLNETSPITESGILVFDSTTGEMVDRLRLDGDLPVWPRLPDWRGDGIYFLPLCYACDAPLAGTLSRWDPASGEPLKYFVAKGIQFFDINGDRLEAEDQHLLPIFMDTHAVPDAEIFNLKNTVEHRMSYAGTPIYTNPYHPAIDTVRWVANGDAMIVQHRDGLHILVWRNGAMLELTNVTQSAFLTGTPTGWLTVSPENNVSLHTLDDVSAHVIAEFDQPVALIRRSPLGQRDDGSGLSRPFGSLLIPPDMDDAPTATAVACPNLNLTRLEIGGEGRVIEGNALNIRKQPATDSEIFDVIYSDEIFTVVDGPQCGTNGLVWWQISFENTTGWIAELQDNRYFAQPN